MFLVYSFVLALCIIVANVVALDEHRSSKIHRKSSNDLQAGRKLKNNLVELSQSGGQRKMVRRGQAEISSRGIVNSWDLSSLLQSSRLAMPQRQNSSRVEAHVKVEEGNSTEMSVREKLIFILKMGLAMCAGLIIVHFSHSRQSVKANQMKAFRSEGDHESDAVTQKRKGINIGPACKFPSIPLAEQFRIQAETEPHRVALVAWLDGNRVEITYKELLAKITQMGKQLLTLNVQKGDNIALVLDRGVHQVVAIYSVMLCGAAWIPIDPEVPRIRFENLLSDSDAQMLLYQEGFEHMAGWATSNNIKTAKIPLDSTGLRSDGVVRESDAAFPSVTCTDKSVIFYTSGTTGKPKGVVYSHEQLNNGANTFADDFHVGSDSIGLLKSSYIWVTIEWEVFPVLLRGGRLVVASARGHHDVAYLASLISTEQVTNLVVTPKVLDILLDVHAAQSRLCSLMDVISVGDALPVELANRFVKTENLPARFHNSYAATESSTVFYTVPPCGVDTQLFPSRTPVGLPQAGVTVWILDRDRKKVKYGAEGEICFGGQLADGYYSQDPSTSEKFIDTSQWGRLYCTGDIGRFRANVLEVIGRMDRQVKIRGIRIEPEEVEASIRNFRQVTRAFQGISVVASPEPAMLTAFVSPKVGSGVLDQIKKHCEASLPPHFVPTYFFSVSELPSLPNGKTDLLALSQQAEVLIQGERQILDSLGLMQGTSRAAITETKVIHRCYAFWMLCVIIGHWYRCGLRDTPTSKYHCLGLTGPGVPAWLELFMRQLGGGEVTMFGFILLAALQDSHMRPGEEFPQVHLGYRDLYMYIVFLLMAFPLPQILYAALGPGLIRESAKSFWGGRCATHRWYLIMILYSRLIVHTCQRLRVPRILQMLTIIALAIFFPVYAMDPCSTNMPDTPRWLLQWLLTPAFKDSGGTCPIVLRWLWSYVFMYVVSFHFSRSLMDRILKVLQGKFDGPRSAFAAFGLYFLLGSALSAFLYPNITLDYPLQDPDFTWSRVPFDIFVPFLQAVLLPLAMTWFPFDLKWWGSTALGTYVFHDYVKSDTVSSFLLRVSPGQGMLQLLVLLAGPLVFSTVFGPLGNYVLFAPQRLFRFAHKHGHQPSGTV